MKEFLVRFFLNDYSISYEQCFISTIFEHADKKFKVQIQFARALWPDKTDANVSTRLRAMRGKNSRGKQQGIKMEDAARMSEILNLPLSTLALEVETKLRLGWKKQEGGELALLTIPWHVEIKKEAQTEIEQEQTVQPTGRVTVARRLALSLAVPPSEQKSICTAPSISP